MGEETKIQVPGNWLRIDFHVHSPSSPDFEGIGKDDSGYIWLLEQAKTSDLDILCVTDHNDINGYLKLIEIESDLRSTRRTLERTNSEIPDGISQQIELFNKTVVLPGVELDVRPNLHLLILFDPQTLDLASTFLTKAGYSEEVRGEENSSKYGQWYFEQTLSEAEQIGAIVLAAHVDSDKGLYEVSKKWGQDRISAFCNEYLYGMEFINPVSRDQIESIFLAPDYNRKSKLAFIQSSDFHGKTGQKIGERSTFVRLDDIERHDKHSLFQALKRALRNPDEFISAPGRPELQAILRRLDDKPAIERIDNEEDKDYFTQLICAYSNTEDGTIVVGRNSKGNWIGQNEISEDDFADHIYSIINENIHPSPILHLQVYPYYENKYIATIRIKKNPKICTLGSDDRVYILQSDIPKLASTNEIINLAENRFIDRYSHLSITTKLSEISQKLLGTEDSIDILPIVRKIDNKTIPLRMALTLPELGAIINDDSIRKINIDGNGYIEGNIVALSKTKPRYEKHYLRISAPKGQYNSESSNDFDDKFLFSGEKIIITPEGGVYFDSQDNIIVACYTHSPLVFTTIHDLYQGDLKFITAYLKSSVAIWYAERCLGSHDIRNLHISLNLPIPNDINMETLQEAKDLVDEILDLEIEYLGKERQLLNEFSTRESRETKECKEKSSKIRDTHNHAANSLIGKLDNLFYTFFGLSNKEIDIIEQGLQSVGFVCLSERTKTD